MAVDARLVERVRRRAHDRCEYCQLPQAVSSTRFQIDHVIAEQHGGRTVAANLALACLADNNHKGPNLAGIDPKTGKRSQRQRIGLGAWSCTFPPSGGKVGFLREV